MFSRIANFFQPQLIVPEPVDYPAPPEYLHCTEVDNGAVVAGHIFQKKYGQAAPEVPRHFVAFYHHDQKLTPLCYLHLREYKGLYLVGGACTDGAAFGAVSEQHSRELRETNGVFFFLLRHAFDKLQGECEAFFGYCGDARALEVDLQAGFEETDRKYILIHAPNGLSAKRRLQLLDDIESIGPF